MYAIDVVNAQLLILRCQIDLAFGNTKAQGKTIDITKINIF